MPLDARAAPRPGPRPSSSREEIVQRTIRMLDREGAEALTFRAVAREFGMTAGALSRYFKNLADLEDAVAATLIAQVRPLDAANKSEPREQLVRLGMDWVEVIRAHPYLGTIHGPASVVAVTTQTAQCLKVLTDAGHDFERAMFAYSLVVNLAYAWGLQDARQQKAELQPIVIQAFTDVMPEFSVQFRKLAATSGPAYRRRWLQLSIDGLLQTPAPKRR